MTKTISYRAKGIVLVLGSIIKKHLFTESFQYLLSDRTEIKRNCSKILPWINDFRLDIKSSKGKHHSIRLASVLARQVPVKEWSFLLLQSGSYSGCISFISHCWVYPANQNPSSITAGSYWRREWLEPSLYWVSVARTTCFTGKYQMA